MLRWIGLFLWVMAAGGTAAHAQTLEAPDPSALDPRLRAVVAAAMPSTGWQGGATAAPVAPRRDKAGGPRRYAAVVRTSAPARLRAVGIPVHTVLGTIVTTHATAPQLYTLSRLRSVRSVTAPRQYRPLNDAAVGLSGGRLLHNGRLNDTEYRGRGVLACVIDTGLDYTHRDVRGLADPTRSRIVGLWDQTLSPQPGEQTPADRAGSGGGGLDYGVEYTRDDVEDEIDGAPAGAVRHRDRSGHGSHVAGTLAGNSGADSLRRYGGMAPRADIAAVKTDFSTTGLLDGLTYCGAVAAERDQPVVVNLSLGGQFGPHDGTLPLSAGVTNWVRAAPGRAVVAAAGNSGDRPIHGAGTVPAGGATTLRVDVPPVPNSEQEEDVGLDVWLDDALPATVTVTSPGGTSVSRGPETDTTAATPAGRIVLRNVSGRAVGRGDRSLRVQVDDGAGTVPAAGTWTITIRTDAEGAVGYHGWLYDARMGGARVRLEGGNSRYTVAAPATADGAIAVGGYVHRRRWCDVSGTCHGPGELPRTGDIAGFSSVGPRRDGTLKPDLVAPGLRTGSVYSDDLGPIGRALILPGGAHRILQGTSVSAPVGAGAAALLLQEDGALTASALKQFLTEAARTDAFTSRGPTPTWGHGKLDATTAMATVLGGTRARRQVLAYDDGPGPSVRLAEGARAAVRFTPPFDGAPSGVLLHPGRTEALRDSLTVAVWADDGTGRPAEPLGAPVRVAPGAVRTDSWTYVDVTPTGVPLQAGTDYHLVVAVPEGGRFALRTGGGDTSGRSSLRTATGWGAAPADWRLRPVVTTTGVGDAFPERLARFSGRAEGAAAVLSWTREAGRPLRRVVVQERTGPGAYERRTVVAATDDRRRYKARIPALNPGGHTFRLRQEGRNGAVWYSRPLTVDVGPSETARVSAVRPNPVRRAAQVTVTVPAAQPVRATLYDALGRRVAVVHDRVVPAQAARTIRVEGAGLASGLYVLRVEGDTFSAVRKLMRL